MNFIKQTLFVFFIFDSSVVLADSGLCQNLAKYSCAPGLHSDGTGSQARLESIDQIETPLAIFKSKRPQIKEKMKGLISGDSNKYFFRLAKSALGLADGPACVSQEPADQKKCASDVAEGLTDFTRQILLSGERTDYVSESRGIRFVKERTLLLNNPKFKELLKATSQEFDVLTRKPELEAEIRDQWFPEIQNAIKKRISRMNIPEKQKQFMIDKVMGNSFAGTSCGTGDLILQNFEPNAMNDAVSHSFQICKGLLRENSSRFSIAGIIVHELTHDIDPCNISIGPDSDKFVYKNVNTLNDHDDQYPVEGLLGCLRSDKSVGALRVFAQPKNASMYGNGSYGGATGYPATAQLPEDQKAKGDLPKPVEESKPVSPKSKVRSDGMYNYMSANETDPLDYCTKNDQIGESTSDWYTGEVVPELMAAKFPKLTERQWQEGAANIFRPICDFGSLDDDDESYGMGPFGGKQKFDEHPPTAKRINAILSVNPVLREKMGCKEPHKKFVYCDVDKPEVVKEIAAEFRAKMSVGMQVTPGKKWTNPYSTAPGGPKTESNSPSEVSK